MTGPEDIESLKRAISQNETDIKSSLFVWLAAEPRSEQEYVEVVRTLFDASFDNLAHFVVNWGLRDFPKSDALAVFALRLEMVSFQLAA